MIKNGSLFETTATRFYKNEMKKIEVLQTDLKSNPKHHEMKSTMSEINKYKLNHPLFRNEKILHKDMVKCQFEEVNKI